MAATNIDLPEWGQKYYIEKRVFKFLYQVKNKHFSPILQSIRKNKRIHRLIPKI